MPVAAFNNMREDGTVFADRKDVHVLCLHFPGPGRRNPRGIHGDRRRHRGGPGDGLSAARQSAHRAGDIPVPAIAAAGPGRAAAVLEERPGGLECRPDLRAGIFFRRLFWQQDRHWTLIEKSARIVWPVLDRDGGDAVAQARASEITGAPHKMSSRARLLMILVM